MNDLIQEYIGRDIHEITWWQMAIRAFVMFFAALVLIRIAGMRTFGAKSAFDTITAFMLGAVLARAIPGTSPFFPTILAGLVIALLHRGLALAAFYSHSMGNLIKGRPQMLYKKGEFYRKNMRLLNISERDILENIRVRSGYTSFDDIEEAYFERSGIISIIPKKKRDETV
jgi:uncharacterized membrane protein YcaP (DUF421 family)